jgi:CheY-like chemotaxis protein
MKRVLILDDDVRLSKTLGKTIEALLHHEVLTEDNGHRAVANLDTIRPDLIILDMSMPAMSGVQFLKAITKPDGTLKYPVLVLTSRANMAAFFEDIAVSGFATKPCDPQVLCAEVSRVLALQPAPASPAAPAVSERILIGEDDPRIGGDLVAVFKAAGYGAEFAMEGTQVIERAVALQPSAIVMKQFLSGLNGDAVARMLMRMPSVRHIPVVLYGPASNLAVLGTASAHPGVAKVVWSADPATLVEVVGSLLRH